MTAPLANSEDPQATLSQEHRDRIPTVMAPPAATIIEGRLYYCSVRHNQPPTERARTGLVSTMHSFIGISFSTLDR